MLLLLLLLLLLEVGALIELQRCLVRFEYVRTAQQGCSLTAVLLEPRVICAILLAVCCYRRMLAVCCRHRLAVCCCMLLL
jgi:hypothetical protein